MKKTPLVFFTITLICLPVFVFAGLPTPPGYNRLSANNVEDIIISVLNIVWIAFIGIAVVSFILAGIYFLLSQGDPTKAEEAKRFVIWGTVGVAVAIVGFSIVVIVRNSLTPRENNNQPVGACCVQGLGVASPCTVTTEESCDGYQGSFYVGDNTECRVDTCNQ